MNAALDQYPNGGFEQGDTAKVSGQKFSLSRVTHSDEGSEDAQTNEVVHATLHCAHHFIVCHLSFQDKADNAPKEISSLPRTDYSGENFDDAEANKVLLTHQRTN